MKMITIMPERMGGYAWLKQEDDGTTYVGVGLSQSGYKVSDELANEFAQWRGQWEGAMDREDANFDWDDFHRRGLALARAVCTCRARITLSDATRSGPVEPSATQSEISSR